MRCAADKRRPGGVWSAAVNVWSAFGRRQSAEDLTHREVCRRQTPSGHCLVGAVSVWLAAVGGSRRLVGVWSATVGAWSALGRRLVSVVGVCQRQTSHNAFVSQGVYFIRFYFFKKNVFY